MKSEKISIRISVETKNYLNQLKDERNCSMSELLNMMIDWHSKHEQAPIHHKEQLANALIHIIEFSNTYKHDDAFQLQTQVEVIQKCLI